MLTCVQRRSRFGKQEKISPLLAFQFFWSLKLSPLRYEREVRCPNSSLPVRARPLKNFYHLEIRALAIWSHEFHEDLF